MERSRSEICKSANMIINEYEAIPNLKEVERNEEILNELYTLAEKESKLVDDNYNPIEEIPQSILPPSDRGVYILYDKEIDGLIRCISKRIIDFYHQYNIDKKH